MADERGTFMARMKRWKAWSTAVVALAVPMAMTPVSPVSASGPWWCAADATLSAPALPGVLPVSACSLQGRVIVSARGLGVSVPEPGYAVASSGDFTDGVDDLSVWADEYAVYVDGNEYDAALGYLAAIRVYLSSGTGSRADLERMARSVRSLVVTSSDRVRTAATPMSVLLDAADTVVAAVSGDAAADVLPALDVLDAQVRRAFAVDESPSIDALIPVVDEVRTALRAPEVDRTTAERVLAHAVLLRNFAISQAPMTSESDGVGSAVPILDRLVWSIRAAIGRDGTVQRLVAADTEQYESMLADLSDYLGREVFTDDTLSVPMPGLPSIGDPTDGTASSGAPPACSDGARSARYADRGHWKRDQAIPWYYNHSNHYVAYTADGYAMKLQEAFDNITELHDDCGYTWRPLIGNTYKGYATQTSMQPLTPSGFCQDRTDGKNIVGWLTLDVAKILARTCTYRVSGVGDVNGFDIAIARNTRWNIPEFNACERYAPYHEWDFEAVLTHEFGHAVALGHVNEAAHGNLTMSEINNGPCARGERTPGRGDAIGLAVLYTRDYS
ncbi:MAG TPA: hypothetical protein VNQ77_06665 [Frankiaceae bacterium]|nr:hypothetical protein [Frankiaceae bacterium]